MSALFFDCDGVLADTERYGHLPAFNRTFEAFGLPVRWSEEDYAELVKIGGGKERMATLFADRELVEKAGLPKDPEGQRELLLEWHKHQGVHRHRLPAGDGEPTGADSARRPHLRPERRARWAPRRISRWHPPRARWRDRRRHRREHGYRRAGSGGSGGRRGGFLVGGLQAGLAFGTRIIARR